MRTYPASFRLEGLRFHPRISLQVMGGPLKTYTKAKDDQSSLGVKP